MKNLFILWLIIICYGCERETYMDCDQSSEIVNIDSVKVKNKVLIIGIDGFRSDAMTIDLTPFMYSLSLNSKVYYNSLHTVEEYTWSGPNWSSILTGVHTHKHNVISNSFHDPYYDQYPPFFSYIEANSYDINTASIVNWTPINNNILSSFVDFCPLESMNDSMVFTNGKNMLLNADPFDPDVLFLHFDELDGSGHNYGYSPIVPEYTNTLNVLDSYVENLFTIIDNKISQGENWMVMIISDHGGEGTSHGDVNNPNINKTIFFVYHSQLNFKANYLSNQCDLAPTILDFMGIISSEFKCETDGTSLLN